MSEVSAMSSEPHPSAKAARAAWARDPQHEPFAAGVHGETDWKLYRGDCIDVLGKLPDHAVNCVVTSPPYYWQRDYEAPGQFGMEPTPEEFVGHLRQAFAEVRRVLTRDGVVFLNLGDTYYSAKGRPHGRDAKHRSRRLPGLRAVDGPGLGLPRKSLIGIPWRVALALQADGWTLRSDIIWVRTSAIPEPTARDRPWRMYEHVLVFSQQPRYYFNRDGLAGEEDVWYIEPDRNAHSRGTHFAPYPRELVRRCVLAGCPQGGVVLDPFVGGGTTMYEALAQGRSAVGIELNEKFCSLIQDNLTQPGSATRTQLGAQPQGVDATVAHLREFFEVVSPHLHGSQRRVVAGAMARMVGRNGKTRVAAASGMKREAVSKAQAEVEALLRNGGSDAGPDGS